MGLFGSWKELKGNAVPGWVVKAANKWRWNYIKVKGHSPYDVMTCFNGKTFRYKVESRTVLQGNYEFHYFKKKIS